jgi:hypothetical protein
LKLVMGRPMTGSVAGTQQHSTEAACSTRGGRNGPGAAWSPRTRAQLLPPMYQASTGRSIEWCNSKSNGKWTSTGIECMTGLRQGLLVKRLRVVRGQRASIALTRQRPLTPRPSISRCPPGASPSPLARAPGPTLSSPRQRSRGLDATRSHWVRPMSDHGGRRRSPPPGTVAVPRFVQSSSHAGSSRDHLRARLHAIAAPRVSATNSAALHGKRLFAAASSARPY